MNESYINEQGMETFYRDFNEKGQALLEKYDKMQAAIDEGASGIRGLTQSSLDDASMKIMEIRQRIEDILLRYNSCMSDSIKSMSGLDANAASKMRNELANMSAGIKKRAGAGGGASGGTGITGTSGGENPTPNPNTNNNENQDKQPFKPNNDNSTSEKSIDDRIKEIQEKMKSLKEDLNKKQERDETGRTYEPNKRTWEPSPWKPTPTPSLSPTPNPWRPTPIPSPNPIPSPRPLDPIIPGNTGNPSVPSTGTDFTPKTNGSLGGGDLGTTSTASEGLNKMSTGEEGNLNLENGEVIEEGKLTDVAPSDNLSDENLELSATEDDLMVDDKKNNNNLLKFAGIGGMLLGSGALAAGLAKKNSDEELSIEETEANTSDELEDEYSQELKDFYE